MRLNEWRKKLDGLGYKTFGFSEKEPLTDQLLYQVIAIKEQFRITVYTTTIDYDDVFWFDVSIMAEPNARRSYREWNNQPNRPELEKQNPAGRCVAEIDELLVGVDPELRDRRESEALLVAKTIIDALAGEPQKVLLLAGITWAAGVMQQFLTAPSGQAV